MRILTWNICGGKGMDGKRSLERIAQVLAQSGAGVVCLQEVHRYLPFGATEDQPSILAKRLKMQVAYASGMRIYGGFGNAILSRWPIEGRQTHVLPNPRERKRPGLWLERRIVQQAEIVTPDGTVTVFNTHWSLDVEDRLGAARLTTDLAEARPGPVVLCGDMNARSESAEMRLLAEAGLTDAGSSPDVPTYPSDSPRLRIDYVWTRGLAAAGVRVLVTTASDHRPLTVDVSAETA